MVSKLARQNKILQAVRETRVPSQQALARLLRRQGIAVTQSTLSRDIRELGLVKARGIYQDGRHNQAAEPALDMRRSFRQWVVGSGISGNIVMLKTSPGHAHSLGVMLDSAAWPEVLGTVAGDDTVFVLLRDPRKGKKVMRRIEELST
jgi:transcriptional regulator of arginine metabolism